MTFFKFKIKLNEGIIEKKYIREISDTFYFPSEARDITLIPSFL